MTPRRLFSQPGGKRFIDLVALCGHEKRFGKTATLVDNR